MDRIDFKALTESILDAIIAVDENGKIFYYNTAFCYMFGYSITELLGKPLDTIVPTHLKERHKKGFSAYVKTSKKTINWKSFESEAQKKDGTVFPVLLSFGEYYSRSGRYFTCLIKDETETSRLKKIAETADLRYKFFLSSSNEGIWRFGLDKPISTKLSVDEQVEQIYKYGSLKECNDAMAKTYGYTKAEELIGARLGDLVPKTEDNIAYLRAFIESGYYLIDAESTELSKDGKTLHILNTLIGHIEGDYLKTAWGVQRDITELVQKQIALEITNDELEHFAYAVSHDIQDPIRLIYSYAELLQKNPNLPSEDIKLLNRIEDTARRIETFTITLLQHAQAGKKEITTTISSMEAVETAIKNLQYMIDESKAEIEYSELLNVDMDSVNLVQIFQNIISNAIKYKHPDRIPKVRITSKLLYNYVQFTITDNGIGIKAEQKDTLFHMYHRLPAEGVYKSGVGLAIVKKILNSYGGRINVGSEDGVGTSIWFTVPKGNI